MHVSKNCILWRNHPTTTSNYEGTTVSQGIWFSLNYVFSVVDSNRRKWKTRLSSHLFKSIHFWMREWRCSAGMSCFVWSNWHIYMQINFLTEQKWSAFGKFDLTPFCFLDFLLFWQRLRWLKLNLCERTTSGEQNIRNAFCLSFNPGEQRAVSLIGSGSLLAHSVYEIPMKALRSAKRNSLGFCVVSCSFLIH